MPPIARDLCLSTGEVTDPLVRPGGRWVSGIHTAAAGNDTLTVLRMWPIDGGPTVDLLVEPVPVTGRGLSGGVHTWNRVGDTVFAVTKTDGVVQVTLDGDSVMEVCHTPFDATRSWSTPSLGDNDTVLYAVADWCELWRWSLTDGSLACVARVNDGYLMDADGPTGRCMTWQRPHMSWTTSSVLGVPHSDEVAVQQPRSTRDGATRGLISDVGGVANVVIEPDAHCDEWTRIVDDREHAGPVWGPGSRTWCLSPDGRHIAYTRNEEGFGSLWVFDRASGTREMIGRGVHGCLSWEADTLAAYRCGARTAPQVVAYDMSAIGERRRTIVVNPADPRWAAPEVQCELVEPTMHRAVADDGVHIPYRLFEAAEPHGGVIVWVHGGPIDQWQVTFRARHVYWLSRGWSIVVVDHRGTTGWGRNFTHALEGRWGDLDARDTATVVAHVQREHGFAPGTTVLMGSSAGGLTALNTIRLVPERVSAAVLAYPVVDLAALLTGDDLFETHYMPRLIGADSPDDPILRDRSPHLHGDAFASTSLLVFHGTADTAVPLSHSTQLRDAVIAAGGACELVVFEGEGHGFKQRANVEHEIAVTEQFLNEVLRDSGAN